MNLYFIVEGRRTEKKVYPTWINHLIPSLIRVNWAFEASGKNYYLFNGNGFPALLHNHLKSSVEEINELGVFNYLILILDVDESTVEGRITEVRDFLIENSLTLIGSTELVIIPQNRCIESWFLGNRRIFKANPQHPDLIDYVKFYNVREDDPEKMGIFDGFNTHSQFHAEYCTQFLRERNIRYSKNNPNGVTEIHYLNALKERESKTPHLQSFKTFIDFCEKVNSEM